MSVQSQDSPRARPIALDEAVQLVWTEAELLDDARYDEWLALWAADGRYIVPIDPKETDPENALNYAYDDDEMRRMRVQRLMSGFSISALPPARTVRTVSRFRMHASTELACQLRCAQILVEQRLQASRIYAVDVEFQLVRTADGLRIGRKVARLVDPDQALRAFSYLL
jgi:3-phenylpropionate/cinnamic acid dioxygenase small subunit